MMFFLYLWYNYWYLTSILVSYIFSLCLFFSLFPTKSVWLEVYQFYWFYQRISFLFHLFIYLFFKIYFIDYAITVVPFPPLYSPPPCTSPPTHLPSLSSCPWVIHISSLASPFPRLFLTSPCLFCTCHLCFLFLLTFSPFSPHPLPTDNPPRNLHFCDSVPVLVVCLVCFCFFRFSCW